MRAKNNERILVLTEISAVLRIDPEEMLFDAHGDFIKGIKIAVARWKKGGLIACLGHDRKM